MILVARIDSFSIGDPEQDIIGRTLMSGTLRDEMSISTGILSFTFCQSI